MALIKWFFLILCPLGLHPTRIENKAVCNLLLFNAWILFSRGMQHNTQQTGLIFPKAASQAIQFVCVSTKTPPCGCILSFLYDTLQYLFYGSHFKNPLALCRCCATCCKPLCWSVIVSLPIMSPAQAWQTLQPNINQALSSINIGAFLVYRQ